MKRGLALLPVLLVMVAGCTDPARAETASLVDAVTRFRLAPDSEKHARMTDIQNVRCTAKDVCDTRDVCLRMAEEQDHSLALRVQVNQALKELKENTLSKDDPRAQGLPAVLDESQAALELSHTLAKTCDERIADITGRHR